MNPDGLIIALNEEVLKRVQAQAECQRLAEENQVLRAALAEKGAEKSGDTKQSVGHG